ncbi:hypothetical protein ACFL96_05155 [Thermoproteota archaeon]
MIIGVIGLLMLAFGWIAEARRVMREKKSQLGFEFAYLYIVGSLCLVIYSLQLNDIVFVVLNLLVVVTCAISMWYALKS